MAATDRPFNSFGTKGPNDSHSILRIMNNLLSTSQAKLLQGPERVRVADGVPGNYSLLSKRNSTIYIKNKSAVTRVHRALAVDYVLCGHDPAHFCEVNSVIASRHARYDHERVFRLLRSVLGRSPAHNVEKPPSFHLSPVASTAIKGLYVIYIWGFDAPANHLSQISTIVVIWRSSIVSYVRCAGSHCISSNRYGVSLLCHSFPTKIWPSRTSPRTHKNTILDAQLTHSDQDLRYRLFHPAQTEGLSTCVQVDTTSPHTVARQPLASPHPVFFVLVARVLVKSFPCRICSPIGRWRSRSEQRTRLRRSNAYEIFYIIYDYYCSK